MLFAQMIWNRKIRRRNATPEKWTPNNLLWCQFVSHFDAETISYYKCIYRLSSDIRRMHGSSR